MTLVRYAMSLALALFGALPASAATDMAVHPGSWAVRSGQRTLMLVTIARDDRAPGGWRAEWQRPEHFTLNRDADTLSDVHGAPVTWTSNAAKQNADGIDFDFPQHDDGAAMTIHLRFAADNSARLSIPGGPPDARMYLWPLSSLTTIDASPDPDKSYPLARAYPTNPQMTAIFDADQKDREDWQHADVNKVATADAARREQTRKLLDSGVLQSGTDFFHAAFVFQHGTKPESYLLAHVLATVAIARGRSDASWIASATLDRYLQTLGKPQVFGTQYSERGDSPTTQDPYDPDLVPDALRKVLGVRSRAEQAEQRAAYDKQRGVQPAPKERGQPKPPPE